MNKKQEVLAQYPKMEKFYPALHEYNRPTEFGAYDEFEEMQDICSYYTEEDE